MLSKPSKMIAVSLIAAMSASLLPMRAAQASLVPTQSVIEQTYTAEAARDRVNSFMAREDVRAEFEKQGVNPDEAAARVAALSDADVSALAGRIESDPSGQGTVGTIVGAALIVFLVLLFTDIVCLTNVFSFTRCARN
jgi:cysteine synthase